MKLSISSIGESFRRAGHAFTREARVIELHDKKDAEKIAAIKAEPMLRVSEVAEVPEDDGGEKKTGKAAK